MDESSFHELADELLTSTTEIIEMADGESVLEVDLVEGVLTILLPDENEIVINKHTPTAQIWMSSPASGASYFAYSEDDGEWCLPDGATFDDVIAEDLHVLASVELK